jgi:hypothetical protein
MGPELVGGSGKRRPPSAGSLTPALPSATAATDRPVTLLHDLSHGSRSQDAKEMLRDWRRMYPAAKAFQAGGHWQQPHAETDCPAAVPTPINDATAA